MSLPSRMILCDGSSERGLTSAIVWPSMLLISASTEAISFRARAESAVFATGRFSDSERNAPAPRQAAMTPAAHHAECSFIDASPWSSIAHGLPQEQFTVFRCLSSFHLGAALPLRHQRPLFASWG